MDTNNTPAGEETRDVFDVEKVYQEFNETNGIEHPRKAVDFFYHRVPEMFDEIRRLRSLLPPSTPADAAQPLTYDHACKVCGNVPDEEGMIAHGRGCYTQSADGTQEPSESAMETAEILADPEMMAALTRSAEDVAAGRLISWDQVKRGLQMADDTPCPAPRSTDAGTPIPPLVYYVSGADNFYGENDHKGQGTEFYRRWKSRSGEFPQRPGAMKFLGDELRPCIDATPPRSTPAELVEDLRVCQWMVDGLERIINETPSGNNRNLFCDINIMLQGRFPAVVRELIAERERVERLDQQNTHMAMLMKASEHREFPVWQTCEVCGPAALDETGKCPKCSQVYDFKRWRKLTDDLQASQSEVARLTAAIVEHRSQKADDRCIEDDDRLYESLGDGIKCDRRVGDIAAELQRRAALATTGIPGERT